MTLEPSLSSSRLENLGRELAAGNALALDAFWREISQQGTPLIEPIPGDDRHSLVTFIWRSENKDRTAAVVNALPGRDSVEEMK